MFYDNVNRLWALCVLFCAYAASTVARDFEKKVSQVLHEEPENPKCFAEGVRDLTCFWVEDEESALSVDQYSFTYSYQNKNSSICPVRAVPAPGGKTLYVCRLNQTLMFVPLDIRVERNKEPIHNRSLFIELVFLLDPPMNVTVSSTDQQGQLGVSWLPPNTYMEDSMMYEVSYAPADSHRGQVEEVRTSMCVLRGLEPGTQYKVRVRVKLDGISYSGYWSAWTEPVLMHTLPGDLDPLIVSLCVIISLILTLLTLTVLMSHRRFLIKKVWPVIPNPESKFQGLFTVYGGDFQEWLGQTSGGVWFTPAFFYSEESSAPLEVLSEVSLSPPPPPPALPPKTSHPLAKDEEDEGEGEAVADEEKRLRRVDSAEGWREPPHDRWLMEQLRTLHQPPGPHSQSSLLESHDAYVTLNAHDCSRDEPPLDDILEEAVPLQTLFASERTPLSAESRSDLGSMRQSSGSGRLSSQSSFEYPNHTWPPKGPGYTCMTVADSGVSMDYSPMSSSRIEDMGKGVVVYAHEYKNEMAPHRRPALTRQHPLHSGW